MTYHILTGSVVGLLAALGIAGGVLPGSESRPIGHDEAAEYTQDAMLQRPECGGIEDTTHHNNIPLSDSIASIPEFHDCQRFIHGGGYIARYAIFVAFKLDSLVATLDPDTSGFGRLYEQRSPDTSDPRLVADPTTQTILVRTRGVGSPRSTTSGASTTSPSAFILVSAACTCSATPQAGNGEP